MSIVIVSGHVNNNGLLAGLFCNLLLVFKPQTTLSVCNPIWLKLAWHHLLDVKIFGIHIVISRLIIARSLSQLFIVLHIDHIVNQVTFRMHTHYCV